MNRDELLKYVADRSTPKGECLVWRNFTRAGRPQMPKGRSNVAVRRVLWEAVNGPMAEGMWVRINCGTLNCVAHEHLFLSTNQEAQKDAGEKGHYSRPARIAKIAKTKQEAASPLSREQVEEIRASSEKQKVLAARYGVGKNTISNIVNGKRWKDYGAAGMFSGLLKPDASAKRALPQR